MSSKRKSPPTKLQEGISAPEETSHLPPSIVVGGSDGGGLTDVDETSSTNLSDVGEDDAPAMVHNSTPFYKLSESSSASPSGSEADDALEDDSPPNKTQRITCPDTPTGMLGAGSISALSLHGEQTDRRRNSSECSSPTPDKTSIHYNNNNNSIHNNNSSSHAMKRSMDDVLRKLTSKINHISTLKEERRPTPPSTPNSTHNS